MNNKFILIFFVILNLTATVVDLQLGNPSGYNEFLFDNFNMDQNNETKEVVFEGNLTGDLGTEYNKMSNPETGFVTTALTTFIDAIKLVIGVVALITPFPFISVMFALNMYWLVTTFLSLALVAFWLFGIMEFFRGSAL